MFEGILTVSCTPFDARGRIDFDAYGRLLEFLLDSGVHAICPLGSTGEYYALSLEERRSVLEFVAGEVKGKTRLFAGCNSSVVQEILAIGGHAKELGYEAALMAAPYYALPSTGELIAHFKAMDQALDLPIMLYNFPARTGVDMSPEFLEGVAGCENIFAIKESSGSNARMHEILTQFDGRLELVCGADDQALEYFLWGVRSWVAGASNFLPKQHVALYEACVIEKDFAKGAALMKKLLPMLMYLEGGKYIQSVKYGCTLAGVPIGDPRPPLQALSGEEKSRFRARYESLMD